MSKYSNISKWFIIIESLLLGFGQLARLTLPGGLNLYILELVILLNVLYVFIEKFTIGNPGQKYYQNLVMNNLVRIACMWLLYVNLLFILQSFFSSLPDNLRALSYLVRISNISIFAILVLPSISRKNLQIGVMIMSYLLPAIAILQFIFYPDLRFLNQFGWDPHMYRAVGTILDPPIMGSILGVLFLYQIFEVLDRPGKKPFWEYFEMKSATILILLLGAIVFLFSRSTWAGVFISASVLIFKKRGLKSSLIFAFVFCLLIWLAPFTIPNYGNLESAKIGRLSTVSSRKIEIEKGLRAFLKHPIWGIGFNRVSEYKIRSIVSQVNFDTNNHSNSAFHSFWVTILATGGLIGLVLVGIFVYFVLSQFSNISYILFIPAFIGLFDNNLFHPLALFPLLIVVFSRVMTTLEPSL